jgi:hypothetical protein
MLVEQKASICKVARDLGHRALDRADTLALFA